MAKNLDIGRMRRRVTFLEPPTGKDEFGERLTDWPEIKTVWAKKEPLLGKDLFTARSEKRDIDVKFGSRYARSCLNAHDVNTLRIQDGADLFEVVSGINVDDADTELLCYCRKVQS